MEKVIPRAINYSDIKPEAIENMVKLVRFTPTATVNNAVANDIVRFQLLGNGFFDPYSAYIQIECTVNMAQLVPNLANPISARLLDRSAHSIIGRLVVKSQGTELERIEQFDTCAAMINDTLFSQDQNILHHYEGFPTKSIDIGGGQVAWSNTARLYTNAIPSAITTNILGPQAANSGFLAAWLMGTLNSNSTLKGLCDQGFYNIFFDVAANYPTGGGADTVTTGIPNSAASDLISMSPLYRGGNFVASALADAPNNVAAGEPSAMVPMSTAIGNIRAAAIAAGAGGAYISSPSVLTWCIPIYSGVIGVLMQEKKMIPLSLIPLEVEFTLNPYAFYCVNGDAAGVAANDTAPRTYQVTKFWIFTHILTFEQELHRSLEAIVAESGIFIHFNSFYLAPIATHTGTTVNNYSQINIHAKSINSVHWVFIYAGFEQPNAQRKLHFCNHNLGQVQVRNGTELYPSEPIFGDQRNGKSSGYHTQFYLEMLKCWNKLHDASVEAAFTPNNFVTDYPILKPTSLTSMLGQQANLGRCQYGITFEGEELGMDKSIITGRKGLIPFDINTQVSNKTSGINSFQFIFVKADYIIYVRPDLVVTLLGR